MRKRKESVVGKTVAMAFLCLILFVTNVSICHASGDTGEVYRNAATGYRVLIQDDAHLLTKAERAKLATLMEEITEYGNAIFKTIDKTSMTTSSYAESFYHSTLGKDSGVLFLIDMYNRNIWIFSDGAIYKTVTKSYADTVTDNIYKYASRKEYYTCAAKAFEQIDSLLRGQKIAQPMKYISNLLLAASLALLFNFGLMTYVTKVRRTSRDELLKSVEKKFTCTKPVATFTYKDKTYSPVESSSGGGGGSSGGGGGGSSSGGGGGHSF